MAGNVKGGFPGRNPSGGSSPCISINATVTDGVCGETGTADYGVEEYDDSNPVTAAEVAAIVRKMLSGIRVYVLESDISKAQDDVKGVVGETYF